jgi:hypothetical protein
VRAAETRSALLRMNVPMVKQTFPIERWLAITITKRDRFFRANGRIISRNWAAEAIRSGIAQMEENHQ